MKYRCSYDDRSWRKRRGLYLQYNPLCVYCEREGRVEVATVVDHIVPHKGDFHLFWSQENWQPLCKRCHDSTKAREENRAGKQEVGLDGYPI